MKLHRKVIWIVLISLIVIQLSHSEISTSEPQHNQSSLNPNQLASYPYLEITSEAELQSIAVSESWSGTGSLVDPFIIENYKFEGNEINPSITNDIKAQQNYQVDDFHRFSLVISNIESNLIIRNNQFSFALMMNHTDFDTYPTIEISGNEWITGNHHNNMFLIGDKYLISDNLFFGSSPFCNELDKFPSRVYHRGRYATIEHNIFNEDVSCFPVNQLTLDVPIGAGTLGIGEVKITDNLFESSGIGVNVKNSNVEIIHNDFITQKVAILVSDSQSIDIISNNFYIEKGLSDDDIRFISKDYNFTSLPTPNVRLALFIGSNHYQNWISPDINEDGIVDKPYNHDIGASDGVIQDIEPYVNPIENSFTSYKKDEDVVSSSWALYGVGLILLISVTYMSYFYAYPWYLTQRKIYEGTLSPNTRQIIKELFNSQSVLYYTLIGQTKVKDKEIEEELKEAIPKKIYDFKYLLHPVRMAMLKLLYENLELTSIEMKDIMGVSWNDYTTHSLSLKKHGYINIQDGFVDGKKRQLLTIELQGTEEFKALLDMMQLFMDNTSSIANYIKTAQEKLDQPEQDLYPSS